MWWNKKESFSFNFSFGRLEVRIGQQENIGIMVFFWMKNQRILSILIHHNTMYL